MTRYTASVREKETGEIKVITKDYEKRAWFEEDLRGNGYAIRFISKEEDFDLACEKYYMKKELNQAIRKEIYASDKRHASNLGISVAEYRRRVRGYKVN